MKDRQAAILRKLKEAGLKLPSQRLAIIEALMENTSPSSGRKSDLSKGKEEGKGPQFIDRLLHSQ